MTNYVSEGDVLSLTAPYDVAAGAGFLVGSIFAVNSGASVLNGETVQGQTEGEFTLPKTSALAISVGDKVYWDNSAKEVNKTSGGGNTLVGVATTDAANPSATVTVRLNGSF